MIADLTSVPGVGGIAAAGVLYAGLSLFVTGPLVGERLIERSGWGPRCERGFAASIPPNVPQSTTSRDCSTLLGTIFGSDGLAFCHRHGAQLDAAGDLVKRYAPGPRGPALQSACACAVRETLDHRRTDFALHAGALRLVTPRPVRDLEGELKGALDSSACQRRSS